VARATGIDLTPAMLERAEALGREKGLANLTWQVGEVLPLRFADASFSIVVSRYALHHMQDPRAVVAEMARVARPGGRVLVVDVHVSPDPEKAELYNRMERLRDPSHVRAMPLDEIEGLVRAAGLRRVDTAFYGVEFEAESLIQGSLPDPGGAEEIRRLLAEEVEMPRMGLRAWRQGAEVRLAYPIAAILAVKEA
jgi:SAM-dependent methyltransferase